MVVHLRVQHRPGGNHVGDHEFEIADRERLDQDNNRRLHKSLGNVTPVEASYHCAPAILEERRRMKDATLRQRRCSTRAVPHDVRANEPARYHRHGVRRTKATDEGQTLIRDRNPSLRLVLAACMVALHWRVLFSSFTCPRQINMLEWFRRPLPFACRVLYSRSALPAKTSARYVTRELWPGTPLRQ